jgi:Ca2+-binding EF-hand superfamily protein
VTEIIEGIGRALKQRGAVGLAGLARNFRINDFNKSGTLDRDELRKCLRLCKLDLDVNDFEVLFRHLDTSDDGQVDYDEFLTAVRGPLPSVRKRLIVDIFLAIDERVSEGRKGRGDGKLTIDDLSELFDGKNHPEVKAGRLSASAALTEMITSFEGKNGNRDGEVSLKEWTSYYGDLSASFENDDHFAAMMMGAWPSIFDPKGAAKGFKVLKPPVPQRDIDNLEALLRRSITSRSTASSETKALEKVFKEFDKDNSRTIGFEEFIVAMERFGLCTATDSRTDVSGVTLNVALSDDGAVTGGRLHAILGGRHRILTREEGEVTGHSDDLMHAVSAIRAGVRYSLIALFFVLREDDECVEYQTIPRRELYPLACGEGTERRGEHLHAVAAAIPLSSRGASSTLSPPPHTRLDAR